MTERIEELFDGLASDTLDLHEQDELANLLEDREDWNGLTRLYETLADKADNEETRVELYRKAADVAQGAGDNPEKAVELLGNTLLGSDEEILNTLARMRALLHLLEDWENWVEVAESEVTMHTEPELVVDLLLEMGETCVARLSDLPRALDYFQQAYDTDNSCLEALARARTIFEVQEEWESVFELFQIELEAVDDVGRSAELLCEMGELAAKIGADDDAETCFTEALNYVEAYPRALAGLGLASPSNEEHDTVAQPALDDEASTDTEAHEELSTSDEAVDIEHVEVETCQEPVLPETEQLRHLDDEGETEVQPSLEEASDTNVQEAVSDESEPDDQGESSDTTAHVAADDAEGTSALGAVEESSDTVAHEATEEPSDTMMQQTEADAVVADEQGVEEDSDTTAHETAAEETEEERAARQERYEALMDEAAMSEPEEQVELLSDAARLGRNEEAVRAYLLAIQAAPSSIDVYVGAGRVLSIDEANARTLKDSIVELAEVYPDDETAIRAHALLIGGQYFDEARSVDQGLRELTRKFDPEAVKPWQLQWFIQTGKWRNAQQLVSESFDGDANEVRLLGLKAIGRLAEERAGDADKAVGFWRQAFQMAPDDEDVRAALIRLYPVVGKWKEYGAVLKTELELVSSDDTERRLELIRALIPIASDHLRQDQLVVSLYQELLEYQPDDVEAREALAGRFEKMRNWPQLVAFYEGQADHLVGDELLNLRLKVADIYLSKMRNQVEAIQAFEQVLESYPSNTTALSALEQLYEKRRSWDQYVQVRLTIAENCDDIDERLQLLKALAKYSEKKIRRPQLTLQLWQHILEVEPTDSAALTAMVSLYEQTKDWHGLLDVVTQMQAVDVEPKILANCLSKAGTVASERLNDPEASLPFWNALATLEPDNRRVVESYKKVLIGLQMWDEMEDFLGVNGQWSDLVRVFEAQSAQQETLDLQVNLLERAAKVYDEELEQPEKAARTLERILVLDAGHIDSLRKLKSYYEEKGDLRKLANVLPNLIDLEQDGDAQLNLQFQNAKICLKNLRNPNMALDALKPLIASQPFFEGALELLLEIGQQSRQWEVVAELLSIGADEPSLAESTEGYLIHVLELANIHADKLRNESESIRRYQQVLEHDEHNETALDALEHLFEKTERWFELLQIIEIRTELLDDPNEQCALIERQALLHEERLEDLSSAIDCQLRIVEELGRDEVRVTALRRLYLQTEQFAQLYGLLSDYVEELDDSTSQQPILLELARLAMSQLADPLGAIDHYQAVVTLDVNDRQARQGLEELLDDQTVRSDAARALQPIYEQLEKWSELVGALEILAQDSDEDDEVRGHLETLGAVLTTRLNDSARALPVYGTLLQHSPENEGYLAKCLEMASTSGAWTECTRILELVVGEVDEPSVRTEILRRLGEVYETQQQSTAMAIDAYRRLCEDEPNDAAALEALARLFFAAEQWSDLLEVYRVELDNASDDETKQTKRFQMAQLLEEFLSDPAGAIDLYLEIVAADGENEKALKSLARLFAFEEMWAELADILETQISISQDEDVKREHLLDLAEVRELRLSEIESALEIYEETIIAQPDDERVRHALERLLTDETVRGRAAELLEPVYLERSDSRGLISVLSILQELTEDADTRIGYLQRIVTAQNEALDLPKEAFYTLFTALAVDAGREDLLSQLLELTKRLEAWEEFVEQLEVIAEQSLDPAVASRLFVQVGLVHRDELADVDRARHFLELALARDETSLAAFNYLDDLLSKLSESQALAALLLQRAEVEANEEQAVALRLRAASVYEEQLEDAGNAIGVYQQVLAEDETCTQAIDALERLYRVAERWQDFLSLIEMKIENVDEQESALPLYFQMAETYERELNDFQGAVSAYESILELAPESLDALRRVDRLYELLEQWDEQLQIIERQISLIDDPAVKTNLAFRAAHLKDTRLLDLEEALLGYQMVLEQDAHHEQCLSRLVMWIQENREVAAAMDVLVPQLTENESWTRLISVYEIALEHADILEDRIEINQKIAGIFETNLEDPQQAFQVLGRALNDDMTRVELLDELERLCGALDNWHAYILLLEQSLERIPNAFAAKDLNARLARLCEAHNDDASVAIRYHREVLEVEPDNEATLDALDRLYHAQGDWAALAVILEQRAQFAEDGPREEFLYRLGQCNVEHLADFEKAVVCFEQVLEQSSTHTASILALEGMFERNEQRLAVAGLLDSAYRESEDYRKLHDMNAVLAAETQDENARLNLLLALAEIAEKQLDEAPSAYRWYAEAFVLQPLDEELREQAERYAGRLDRYDDWVERLAAAMERCEDDIRRQDLAVELGLVEFRKLRRIEQAQVAMRFVIDELDPVNPDALEVLDEIYQQTNQVALLIDVLRLRADVMVEDEARVRLKLRLATLLKDGDQADEAINTYEEVVELDSTSTDALNALVELYTARGAWNELLEVYQKQTLTVEPGANQAMIFARMARVASDELQRPEDAIEYWTEVLRLRGEDREALGALEELYTETESWRDLVDVLERQVHLVEGNTDRELSIYEKLGQIWGDELDREEKSIDNWKMVLSLDAEHLKAKWALLDLYERSDKFDAFVSMGAELIDTIDEDSEQEKTLARKLARVATDELKSNEKGIKYWARVLSTADGDEEALSNLEELYTQTDDWRNCAMILQKQASLATDEFQIVSGWFRVAEVAGERLSDSEMLQVALGKVLEVDPKNIDAMQQLEESYDACEMWEDKVGLLLQRLEMSSDSYEQGDLFESIAGLFEEKLGSTDSAFEVYLQAFEATRDEERFGEHLSRLATLPEQWQQVVAMYEQILGNQGTRLDQVEMRLKAAQWSMNELGDAQRAKFHFKGVLAADPTSLPALVSLSEILESGEAWAELPEIIEARINLEDDETLMKSLALKLADIFDSRLGREADAVTWYRRGLEFDPENLDILAALEGALTVQMNWTELVDVFERQIECSVDDAAKFDKQLALAALFENQLNDVNRATNVYQELLENGSVSHEVLMPLKRLLSSEARWYELLDLFPILVEQSQDVNVLTELYTEWADVQMTHLSDTDGAVETLRKLFELIPENIDTVAILDELYRSFERYDELADLYNLHLAALTEAPEIESAVITLATLYLEVLEEQSQARLVLDTYLDKVSASGDAILMLLELCKSEGDDLRRAELLSIHIDALTDLDAIVDRKSELADIYLSVLNEDEKARALYREILAQDPHHVETLRALTIFAKRESNWTEAVELMQLAETHAKTLEDKSAALFEIGAIHAENLDDMATGLEYFEQAVDVWPDNHKASDLLIGHYWSNQNWIRLDPLLRSWLMRNEENKIDEPQYFERCKQMAYCAEMLGDEGAALEHARQALELDRTDLDALEQCGRLLVKSGLFADASTTYLTILAHHRDSLTPNKAASIYQHLGRIKGQQGEMRKALDFFRKALDVDPNSQETQRALIDLHSERGDWNDVVHYQRALLELLNDADDQFELLLGLADTHAKHLDQTRLAIECLEQARELNPESRIVLGKLMELHEQNKDWGALVQVLQLLAEQETDGTRKAKLWCAIAVHQQQHLDDRFTAVRSFDKALDFDPSFLEAFEAIANILNQDRDYARQDRYYRKMLKRALENKLEDKLVFTLGKGLGEINRTRLKNYSEAIKAYKIALVRKPDDIDTHKIIAQLYELEDDSEAAIAQYALLLKHDPRSVETYRNMKKLYLELGRFDEAWCVCQALCFLQVANEEEQEFFAKRRARSLKGAAALTQQQWALINHPLKSAYLDQLLSILYPILMPAMARNLKDFGLHRRKSVVDSNTEIPVNVVFTHVQKITGLGRPTVYQGMQNVRGVLNINTNPPSVAIGPDVLQPSSVQSLCFDIARGSFLGAHPYLLASFPEDADYKARQLRVKKTLYSLMKVINPASQAQHDPGLVELFSTQLQADGLRVVTKLLGEMSQDAATHLDATRWLDGVDLTADRLGLLCSNDLAHAVNAMKSGACNVGKMEMADKIKELIVFSVSPEYMALRTALGIAQQ